MKRPTIGKRFNPETYGMIFCPDCNGSGKSFNDANEVNICKVCGGFGLIKKEEKIFSMRTGLSNRAREFIT